MKQIYIRDSNLFSEQYPARPNEYFEWVWDREPADRPITVFTDAHIKEAESSRSKIKVAWLMEPPVINSFIYEYVRKNYWLFDAVAVFDESLLSIDERFFYCPWGTSWIGADDRKLHPKSKMLSAIFSDKSWTEGHKLRHSIAQRHSGVIDLFGRGYKTIENKIEGLRDYRFQIVVENQKLNSYFTEKLMDCLVTGVVPIYWGFDRASSIFDPGGLLPFRSVEDLDQILKDLSGALYDKMYSSVINNFEIAKNYLSLEKHLWEGCLKQIA